MRYAVKRDGKDIAVASPDYVTVRPFLRHALVATIVVVGAPVVVLFAWIAVAEPNPSFAALLLSGFFFTVLTFAAGVTWWKGRREAADITFGELMIWGWLQRKRTDERLEAGAGLLGLDRSGQPLRTVRIPAEQQLRVLHDLTHALESKDPYTHGHSQRVERHVYRTAATMGLPPSAIEELRMAGALHDVGKIRIPDRILRKPGELTIEERALVEEHAVVGAWMVSSVGSVDVISGVRHHHERWDGRGYPDGLAGTDIPLYARIIAVADAYDAITSTRPYRVSSGREHAVGTLQRESGSQFDPVIVSAFVEALPVRVPVAGVLVLIAGPYAIWRRLAVWIKRVGAGQLGPTVATLSAVVVLGTSIPSMPTPVRPTPAIAAPQAEVEGSTRPAQKAPTRKEPAPRDHTKPEVVTAVPEGRAGTVVQSDRLVKDRAEPATEPETKHGSEPEERADPEPADQGEPAAEEVHESRNPNDGKDGCPRDGDAGEGNDWGCGARSHPREEHSGDHDDEDHD